MVEQSALEKADECAQAVSSELQKAGMEAACNRFRDEFLKFSAKKSATEISQYLERFKQDLPAVWSDAQKSLETISIPLTGKVTESSGTAVNLIAGRDYEITDWASFKSLKVNIENKGSHAQKMELKLENAKGFGGHTQTAFEAVVEPGSSMVWELPLAHLCTTSGFNWPAQPGFTNISQRGWVDITGITSVSLRVPKPEGECKIEINNASLVGRIQSEHWVDAFGQNDNLNWPGKIHSIKELKDSDNQESAELHKQQQQTHSEFDQYHGLKTLGRQEATNFFHTKEIDGSWWLIDPEGYPFFSTGVNSVRNETNTRARMDDTVKKAYSWIPPTEGEFASCTDKVGLSFYDCNLIRKWGNSDLAEKFRSRAIERMESWGFNTLGNWSDLELEKAHKMPYTDTGPETYKLKMPYISWRICDVFAPQFEAEAAKSAGALAAKKDDPWLIGYFLENEIPWCELGEKVLASNDDQPAKRKFLSELHDKYKTIEALNASWGTHAASFETLREPGDYNNATEACKADIDHFRGEFAEKYYRVWSQAIKAADPNHLVLGSRLCDRHEEVIRACAANSDVVSFNYYGMNIDRKEYDKYQNIAHKPFLMGEFGFDSLDCGLQTAFVPVADQKQRGKAYSSYMEQLAALPYFIGGHYFQYIDEPITGRVPDRETAFNGLVSVTDTPYTSLVEQAKQSNQRVYEIHKQSK